MVRRLQPWVSLDRKSDLPPGRLPVLVRPIPIGFWLEPGKPLSCLPDSRKLVDETWDAQERQIITSYLLRHPVVQTYMGASLCRFCGKPNGTGEQTDGSFLWPTGFAHYVSEHGVRPSVGFIEHVLSQQ